MLPPDDNNVGGYPIARGFEQGASRQLFVLRGNRRTFPPLPW